MLRFVGVKEELAHGALGDFGQDTKSSIYERTKYFGKQVSRCAVEFFLAGLLQGNPGDCRRAIPEP
jgi:hypothetical protein